MLSLIRHLLVSRLTKLTSTNRRCKLLSALRVESLEPRTMMATNIAVTDAYLATADGKRLDSVAEGSLVSVQADFSTQGLAANANYTAKLTIDNDSRFIQLDWGKGSVAVGNWSVNLGDWVVRPGLHQVSAELDSTHGIVETSEADNIQSFSFTPKTFESTYVPGQKFITPLAGTPYGNWTIVNYVDLDSSPYTGSDNNPNRDNVLDYRGGKRSYDGHHGLDMTLAGFQTDQRFVSMDVGVPVFAAADGIVVAAQDGNYDRNTDPKTAGEPNFVTIDHGNGWRTIYFHLRMNSVAVKTGDYVKAGDEIGLAGSSGSSSDPHLHFEVQYNNMVVETYVDPNAYWINPLPYAGDPPQKNAVLTDYDQHHTTENGIKAVVSIAGGIGSKTIHYATQDLTAKAGKDYKASSGDVVFGFIGPTKTVSIPILEDTLHEGDETFRVVFTDVATNATWFEDWTIIDNDAIFNFDFSKGTVDINGNSIAPNDVISMNVDVADNLIIKVNDQQQQIPLHGPLGDVSTIEIKSGVGNDTINILATPRDVITTIHGGAGVDTINIGAPDPLFTAFYSLNSILGHVNVHGDAGVDTLNIKDNDKFNTPQDYYFTVDLQRHMDTFWADRTGNVDYDTVSTVNLEASGGVDRFNLFRTDLFIQLSIDGGGGNDTLIGPDNDNLWTINGINSGRVAANVKFKNVENLQGGNQKDEFQFLTAGSVSGNIAGDDGVDTLDYASRNIQVSVDLATSVASSIGGAFSSLEAAVGSSSGFDTLFGADIDNVWNITGKNTESVGGFSASSFENLKGGSMDDRFIFSAGKGLTGKIDGRGGNDTLDYGLYSTAAIIDLPNNKSTGNSGIQSIEAVVGGSSLNDTLLGVGAPAGFNFWNITGPNVGTFSGLGLNIAFSQIESLAGYGNTDLFIFSDGAFVQGKIDGLGGNDKFDYSAYTTPVAFSVNSHTATGTAGYANIEVLIGGQSTDSLFASSLSRNTFNLQGNNSGNLNTALSFSSFENLVGGDLIDSFVFSNAAMVSGFIDGRGQSDTLDYSAYLKGIRVDLALGNATGVSAGIKNIENVSGGEANDFIFGNLFDNVLSGHGGDDQIFGGAGADILLGGDGNDKLDGGADRNILIGGLGQDIVFGGTDEDILIGGSTKYDNKQFVLVIMLLEWKRTDLNYDQRITDLRVTGVQGGLYKLDSASVIDDGVVDKLKGGLGLDWFWATNIDLTDKTELEQ